VSGALAIEGFGEQFVREVSGSYSAILGLPMYQLRKALMSFYFYETLGL
jgi:predicted house-cleaning NTP pyrophosphatase (Maf/HAM1 superfamily)